MTMNKDKNKRFIIADLKTVPEDVSSIETVWKRFGSSGQSNQIKLFLISLGIEK